MVTLAESGLIVNADWQDAEGIVVGRTARMKPINRSDAVLEWMRNGIVENQQSYGMIDDG